MQLSFEPAIRTLESYVEGFVALLPTLVVALVVFLIILAGSVACRWGIVSMFRHRGRPHLGHLLGGFAKWAVIVFGVLVFATIIFPSIKPADLLAALGIGSVAAGFAFKEILQNWLSGLLILYRQPFRIGDQIVSGELEGTVERIEARATIIRTYDGQRIIIPNTDIYTRAIVVRTAFPQRRSEYDIGIGYSDDPEHACRLICTALRHVEGVTAVPEPEAIPWAFESSSLQVKVRWWSDPYRANVVQIHGRAVSAVRTALREAGIDLPFPTRMVLFHDQTEETDGDRLRQREGWAAPAKSDAPQPRHLNEVTVRSKNARKQSS